MGPIVKVRFAMAAKSLSISTLAGTSACGGRMVGGDRGAWAHDGVAAYTLRFAIGAALDDAHRLARAHAVLRPRLAQCCLPVPRRQHISHTVRKLIRYAPRIAVREFIGQQAHHDVVVPCTVYEGGLSLLAFQYKTTLFVGSDRPVIVAQHPNANTMQPQLIEGMSKP